MCGFILRKNPHLSAEKILFILTLIPFFKVFISTETFFEYLRC